MFGIDVERYCIKCKKSISFKSVSTGYTVFDKNGIYSYAFIIVNLNKDIIYKESGVERNKYSS